MNAVLKWSGFITIFFIIQTVRSEPAKDSDEAWKKATSVYNFSVNNIQGELVSLEKYRGNVLLIVNVASQCGLTNSNYAELVELDQTYRERGLRILAFPCNQFANQEPGDNAQIMAFAKEKNATFDFFDKINVNGKEANPLYKYLRMKQTGIFGDAIKWNFTKFIVDKSGQPVDRFGPTLPLTSTQKLKDRIEALL